MSGQTYASTAIPLFERGYEPLPVQRGGKAPLVKDWANRPIDRDQVETWAAQYPDCNVGIRLGTVISIDIDVLEPEVAAAVQNWCLEHLGDAPRRLGQAPKRALLYRVEGTLSKMQSRRWLDANGKANAVEVLGKGQQVVAAGMHPSDVPYRWAKRGSIFSTTADTLTLVTEEQLLDLIAFYEDNRSKSDWAPQGTTAAAAPPVSDPFEVYVSPSGYTVDDMELLLDTIDPNDLSNHQWHKAAAAIKHELGDTDPARELFLSWCDRYDGNDEGESSDLWQRVKPQTEDRHPATVRYLEWLASGRGLERTADPEDAAPDPSPEPSSRRFRFQRVSELTLAPPKWVVKGILEAGTTGIWFGKHASFKTFTVLDLALCIATGRDWHGHPVKTPGPVAYVAGEGHGGFGRRVHAWCRQHGVDIDTIPLYKSTISGNFSLPQRVREMHLAIREDLPSGPVVMPIDTVARNLGGDENNAEDFARLFDELDVIRGTWPDTVFILVGHPGHTNEDRPRGSSSQSGNVDTQVWIHKDPYRSYVTHLTCQKMKDAQLFPDMQIGMAEVELGTDEDGEVYGSLAAVPPDQAAEGGSSPEQDFGMPIRAVQTCQALQLIQEKGKLSRDPFNAILKGMGVPIVHPKDFKQFLEDLVQGGYVDRGEGKSLSISQAGIGFLGRYMWGEEGVGDDQS